MQGHDIQGHAAANARRQPAYRPAGSLSGRIRVMASLLLSLALLLPGGRSHAADLAALGAMIGPRDAIVVTDGNGEILFSRHADTRLVPASILKLLTALAALEVLGPDFRYTTDVGLTDRLDLQVTGRGDPLLVSEALAEMAGKIAVALEKKTGGRHDLNDLVLDDTYFDYALKIPGTTASSQPYDAPNGALCANFNTVAFKRRGGRYVSAEPQTPLLPLALDRIKQSNLVEGRVLLSQTGRQGTLYTGHLLAHFLEQQGIAINGTVRIAGHEDPKGSPLLAHRSRFPLPRVIARLLEHSNNFIANQLLITIGIKTAGPPGTLAKGVQSLATYARETLGIDHLTIVEGSGISRQNRISARDMARILEAFKPYRHLLPGHGPLRYKTGTLDGIQTRAGFYENGRDGCCGFVVMINTPGKRADPVVDALRGYFEHRPG